MLNKSDPSTETCATLLITFFPRTKIFFKTNKLLPIERK